MIGEPEATGNGDDAEAVGTAGASADVVQGDVRGARTRPWRWVFGAVVATSAVWALVLQLSGYGQVSGPDLHHYRLAGSPCGGSNLKPLADALGASHPDVSPADTRTGPALDVARCTLAAQRTVGTHWRAAYNTVVTVQLHKKTDPAAEFDDLNSSPGAPELAAPSDVAVDPSTGVATTGGTPHVVQVSGLGDKAYLLTDDGDQTLTVRHGGAVLSVAVAVQQTWNGPGGAPPPGADGFPQKPPRVSSLRPALVATMRSMMSALSA